MDLDTALQLINDRLSKLEVTIPPPSTLNQPAPTAHPTQPIPAAPAPLPSVLLGPANTSPGSGAAPGVPALPAPAPVGQANILPGSGPTPPLQATTVWHNTAGVSPMIPAQAMANLLTSALQRIGASDVQIGREFDPSIYLLAPKSAAEAFDHSKMDL